MAHILFSPKPNVKFLITTDKSNNLKLFATSRQVEHITGITLQIIEKDEDDYLLPTPISDYLRQQIHDGMITGYWDYSNTGRSTTLNWHQSLESILDHLDFHHPLLYWYIIS